MVWKTSYNAALGMPAFTLGAVDTTPKVAIGTIVKAYDDSFGEGEFIYLPGVASLLAGDAIFYDLLPGGQSVTRALLVNSGQSIAFALVAVPAGSYGWYQLSGVAIANATAAGAGLPAYYSGTAGSIRTTAAPGLQINNARISSALNTPATGQCYVTINRPNMQTQIT